MSRWASRVETDEPDGLILFDGVCVFCSRWVQFVLDHDQDRRFRFTSVQSPYGRALALRHGVDPETPETNAVVMDGRIWFKSDVALKVLAALPGTRPLGALRLVPRGLRDAAYDLIARNRYRLFGRAEVCMIPAAGDRARFLD